MTLILLLYVYGLICQRFTDSILTLDGLSTSHSIITMATYRYSYEINALFDAISYEKVIVKVYAYCMFPPTTSLRACHTDYI